MKYCDKAQLIFDFFECWNICLSREILREKPGPLVEKSQGNILINVNVSIFPFLSLFLIVLFSMVNNFYFDHQLSKARRSFGDEVLDLHL